MIKCQEQVREIPKILHVVITLRRAVNADLATFPPPLVVNPSDELYHVAILIDELKHSDVSLRLNAMRKLQVIGACVYTCVLCFFCALG